MGLIDFLGKQFIDVIHWVEEDEGTLAWRFPMADMEIQNGAVLTVRESQLAVFVDEGRIADVFAAGRYRLDTRTLPVLTNLRHWDKLFASPFKSDVYFFSLRHQLDRRWGTAQPITIRDKDFGAVRLRAFGNYSYRLADAHLFHRQLSGTRERYTVDDLDGQLRGLIVQHISDAVAESGIPFIELAANQREFGAALLADLAPAFAAWGLALESITVQSVSLPEELQKLLDQRIGLSMMGQDMNRFMQYQAAQALPEMARSAAGGSGGVAGDALGLGAGVALGQALGQQLQKGLATSPIGAGSVDEVLALLDKLGALHAKGVLTQAEFETKKAELLRKIQP